MQDSTDTTTQDILDATEKRGRKPLAAATHVLSPVDMAPVAQAGALADQAAAMQAAYGQERDLLNQLLGQAQMADAISKLTATVAVSKMAFVKESKLYRQLAGTKDRDGRGLTGTWEEFCTLLGTSAPKVNEDVANLQSFGEQALESMSAMGIGYRELRQYRKLPEDQKLALIEVAKAGDKEGFVELAEEIIAKHAKEKEQLTAQAQESAAVIAAKDRVLADNAAKITEQAQALEHQSLRASAARQAALWQEIGIASGQAYKGLNATLAAAGVALDEESDAPEALQQHARHAIAFLAQQLADMAHQWRVQIDLAERLPAPWEQDFDPTQLAALAERNNAPGVWQGR